MDPRMFPFAGLFPMQPGHWRRISVTEQNAQAAAQTNYIALPGVVSSCPASLYLVIYEAVISAYSAAYDISIDSTADNGSTWRTLAGTTTTTTGQKLVCAGALITRTGAGFGAAGAAADTGGAWDSTSPAVRAGGPDLAGIITGLRAGVGTMIVNTVTVKTSKLSIWALE